MMQVFPEVPPPRYDLHAVNQIIMQMLMETLRMLGSRKVR
jgi:hypothetical protein